jgi:hypothetical protein
LPPINSNNRQGHQVASSSHEQPSNDSTAQVAFKSLYNQASSIGSGSLLFFNNEDRFILDPIKISEVVRNKLDSLGIKPKDFATYLNVKSVKNLLEEKLRWDELSQLKKTKFLQLDAWLKNQDEVVKPVHTISQKSHVAIAPDREKNYFPVFQRLEEVSRLI